MTIASTVSKAVYDGNGSTTLFPVPFPFVREEDLTVIRRDQRGMDTRLALGEDYAVDGAGTPEGGGVTLNAAPAEGERLLVRREPAIVQETDYQENDAFPAQTHEAALDLLTMIAQGLSERLDRAIALGPTSSFAGLTVPDPQPGRALGWRDDGAGLTNVDPASIGALLLPLSVTQGGTGGGGAEEGLANLGFSARMRAARSAEDAGEACAALGAEIADPALLKSGRSAALSTGYTVAAVPALNPAAPDPAAGQFQSLDVADAAVEGTVVLGLPAADGLIVVRAEGAGSVAPNAGYEIYGEEYGGGAALLHITRGGGVPTIQIVNRLAAAVEGEEC